MISYEIRDWMQTFFHLEKVFAKIYIKSVGKLYTVDKFFKNKIQ